MYLTNKYDSSVMPRAGGNLKKTILMDCGGEGGGKKVEERGDHTRLLIFLVMIY
jgi:hypothetical protein